MLENALWLVRFSAADGSDYGTGVISFKDGKVFGGDSWYFYAGQYQANGQDITAKVRVKQHSEGVSIFGPLREFNLTLSGSVSPDGGKIFGSMIEHPAMKLNAILTKLVSL
jgi:hypothetical protein